LGIGAFATNGNSSDAIGDEFDTQIHNFWIGEYQYAQSGDIWQASLTFGPGGGMGSASLATNTWPAHNCWRQEPIQPWDETDPGNSGVQY
jgi:hypothetical protein